MGTGALMEHRMSTEKQLVTRNEAREIGLKFSSTHFGRLEKAGLLTPYKVGGRRSARVHYELKELLAVLSSRK
jgi:hypothetical protein